MAPKAASKPPAKVAPKPAAKQATAKPQAKAASKAPASAKPAAKSTAAATKKGDRKEKKEYIKPGDVKKAKAKLAKEGKKFTPAPAKVEAKPKVNKKDSVLFVPRPKNNGIGQDLITKRNLTRFVRWPQYIRRQRQKQVLLRRLKVPPAVHQFNLCLDRVTKKQLFHLAGRYRPESKLQRKKRLRKEAEAKAKDPSAPRLPKRLEIKKGLQRVTRLIEMKRAKLVMIAHDVVPLEMVVWLPTLCKTMGVPYCIVKDKAALGRLVGHKTCTCVAFMDLRKEDQTVFDKLLEAVKVKYTEKFEHVRTRWGGLKLGKRHAAKMEKIKKNSAQ